MFSIETVLATHERGGEITYRHLDGLTYEVTILTYTYAPSPADRPELEIQWGDGTASILPRVEIVDLTPLIRRNRYIGEHTFPGAASYTLSLEDPNRNYGIVNIPNSVNIPFYIETELVINPFLGYNNSIILLNPPLDYGCVNKLYVHNPGAYDPDGDSLSYKLVACKGAGGEPIPGFTYPQASNIFKIDAYTGELFWDTPILIGEYNVAMIIEEWRLGMRIGYVTRDMQILIDACDNNPPVIAAVADTCVEAGELLTFGVTASDPDTDTLILTAIGEPFEDSEDPKAHINPDPGIGVGTVSTTFEWATACSNIKKAAYTVYFRASDYGHVVNLIDYEVMNITVVGPAPQNLEAIPLGNSIHLTWNKGACTNTSGYKVYRRTGWFGFDPGHCEVGVPSYTGYAFIKQLSGIHDTTFADDNNGNGLVHGVDYCYMVTAIFPDGAEGYASEEACAHLKKDLPVITHASVTNTGTGDGTIYVAWSKPTELDFNQTPGPFQYKLLHSVDNAGFELLQTYDDLDDTTYTDAQLNTRDSRFDYRVDFYNNQPGNEFFIGSTQAAHSVYLTITETDRALRLDWNDNNPWLNAKFVVFRQDPGSAQFDSIGFTTHNHYLDTGLVNSQTYCYYVKCIGSYATPGIADPLINLSQVNCGTPFDNVPPCALFLSNFTNCETLSNELSWVYPDSCQVEDLTYYIYYARSSKEDYTLLDSTTGTGYIHHPIPPVLVGCYAVTALDSLYNQSVYSNAVCIDKDVCSTYYLPNVFTPNGDNHNDVFKAADSSVVSIERIRLKIFNRWGSVVFKTEDPAFRWDGKDETTNQDCSQGVYFFECTVTEMTLLGPVDRKITGSVTLWR